MFIKNIIDCVYLVDFAGWLDLWWTWTWGSRVLHAGTLLVGWQELEQV